MTTFTHFPVRSGIDTFAIYKEEATYGVNPGTWGTNAKHFGIVQSISPSIGRNIQKIRGITGVLPTDNQTPTSRDALQMVAGKLDVSFDVSFQPQDFSWLKYFFGTVSEAGNKKTYPQATAVTEADKKKYLNVPSISLATRYDFGGSDDHVNSAWVFSGMVNNSLTIKAALGEPVSADLSFTGADLNKVTDVTTVPYTALSSADVYHFVECTAITYGGVALDYIIDGVTFKGTNAIDILGTLGQYTGAHPKVGERNFSVDFDLTIEGIKFFTDVLGGTTVNNPTLISEVSILFKKSNTKNLKINLKDLKLGNLDPSLSYGEIMKGNITLDAKVAWAIEDEDLTPPPPEE